MIGRKFTWSRFFLLFCAMPLLFASCGRKDSVPVVQVTGRVVYKGEALAGASVEFHPDSDQRPAAAITDAEGNFILRTVGAKKEGALPGTYRVAIRKSVNTNKERPVPAVTNGPPGSQRLPHPVLKSVIPEKWSSPETSGLSAVVEKKGENRFVFEIE
ncbi:MAG: carboxypeptidase-like regulatory domain-containing protein [Planctomycetia bacterium]|nr:carboxypeptidase-like regulatory domain-containing protein [Planctomycetia bacterium]